MSHSTDVICELRSLVLASARSRVAGLAGDTSTAPGNNAVEIPRRGIRTSPGPGAVDVSPARPATLDLALARTKDLSSQITSVEWLMRRGRHRRAEGDGAEADPQLVRTATRWNGSSSRGTGRRSQMVGVITRMQKYYPDGTMAGTEGRGRAQFDSPQTQAAAEKNPELGLPAQFLVQALCSLTSRRRVL